MTDNTHQSLPWDALTASEDNIPWQAINAFSEALVANPDIWRYLARRYDIITLFRSDYRGYEDLYIPAIFAKAGPQLSQQTRLEISPFLLEKLSEAGYDDEDIRLEVVSAACGSLGPVILPKVMEFISDEEDTGGAWVFLWSLLKLAEHAEEQIRQQVIDFCVDVLTLAKQGLIALIDVEFIPKILNHLNYREHLGLLETLAKKAKGSHIYVEFNESIQELTGKKPHFQYKEMWETPPDEWLPCRRKLVKKCYAENPDPLSQDEEVEFKEHRIGKLRRWFLRSQEGKKAFEKYKGDVPFITEALLTHLWGCEGVCLENINEQALKEVLLELFPRKVVFEKEELEHVVPVVVIFLKFLEDQHILPNGAELADTVKDCSKEIIDRGMNPKYWGMGKSFYMQAKSDGVDTTDIDAMNQYMHFYNARRLGDISNICEDSLDQEINRAPIPIAGTESKTGRNQPCPCGSGQKYKNAVVQKIK